MGERGRNSDADFDFSCRDLGGMALLVVSFQLLVVFMLWPMGLALNERRKVLFFVFCLYFIVFVRLFAE